MFRSKKKYYGISFILLILIMIISSACRKNDKISCIKVWTLNKDILYNKKRIEGLRYYICNILAPLILESLY